MPPMGRIYDRSSGLDDESIKKNPPKISKDLLKRIFGYLSPYWPYLALVTITILIAAILDLLPAVLTGRIIDDGFIGGDFNLLLLLIAASFGVLVLSNLMGLVQGYLNAWISQSITKDMRNQMYGHLQKMSHRFFTTSKQGEVITRMTSDIGGVESVITGTLTNTISNVAILATSIIAMLQKNWLLALAGVVVVPLMVIPIKMVGKRRWALTLESQKRNDEINQILNETLSVSGQQLVKLFTNEEQEYQKYAKSNRAMFKLNVKENTAGRWFRMAVNTFTSIGPMLIYLAGGILLLRSGYGGLTVGDITVMVALLTRMYRPLSQLLEIQVDFIRAMALFTRIFDYLDLPIEIVNRPDAKTLNTINGALSFDHVHFHYKPETPVLKDVSFQVEAGQTVAIVGPSGAGKSTIISLVVRLFDVVEGAVRLDGVDIRDLDVHCLRKNVGVVTQDSYLFNGTIRENLLYAKGDASDAELIQACKEANIHDFIESLPQGYDSMVGNRGVKLSGGEKQRLSIARVILKDPRLLILDEATSSLDSISESLIQEAIDPLLHKRTSLVIAHRLSTVMAADKILVVQDGRIVEEGAHRELLENGGTYKKLYDTQFQQVIQEYAQLELPA